MCMFCTSAAWSGDSRMHKKINEAIENLGFLPILSGIFTFELSGNFVFLHDQMPMFALESPKLEACYLKMLRMHAQHEIVQNITTNDKIIILCL